MKKVFVVSCNYGILGVQTNAKRVYEGIASAAARNNEVLFLEKVTGEHPNYKTTKLKFTYANVAEQLKNHSMLTAYIEGTDYSEKYTADTSYLNGRI